LDRHRTADQLPSWMQNSPASSFELVRETLARKHGMNLFRAERLQPFEKRIRHFRPSIREPFTVICLRIPAQLLLAECESLRVPALQEKSACTGQGRARPENAQ
jgi:hypothetical protein